MLRYVVSPVSIVFSGMASTMEQKVHIYIYIYILYIYCFAVVSLPNHRAAGDQNGHGLADRHIEPCSRHSHRKTVRSSRSYHYSLETWKIYNFCDSLFYAVIFLLPFLLFSG